MSYTAIVNTVNQMALAADQHNWAVCQDCFADNVFVDYSSLAGGEPATISSVALIESWRGLLPGFTATQHLIGSHTVKIKEHQAKCYAQFQATHILDEAQWVLGGQYLFQLQHNDETWQITGITMTVLWSMGDQTQLLQLAAERASQV